MLIVFFVAGKTNAIVNINNKCKQLTPPTTSGQERGVGGRNVMRRYRAVALPTVGLVGQTIQFALPIYIILMKITEIAASRWNILKLKCTKFDFGWSDTPDPAGKLTDSLAGFQGLILMEWKGRDRKEMKSKEKGE